MANSVVTVTDAMLNDSLLLLVGEDGTVTPDRQTVETYLNSKSGTTNIQLMHINKTDKKGIDISVDHLTYVPDVINEVEFSMNKEGVGMEDIARNLHNFRLDHDYTSFFSPTREEQSTTRQEEDLAQTLAAEGSSNQIEARQSDEAEKGEDEDNVVPPSETSEQPHHQEDTVAPPPKTAKGRAKVITTKPQKQSVVKTVTASRHSDRAKTKEKPKIVQQIEDEFEDDYDEYVNEDDDFDFEDDENDSDFEIEDGGSKSKVNNVAVANKRGRTRRKSQSGAVGKTAKSQQQQPPKQQESSSKINNKEQQKKLKIKMDVVQEMIKVEKSIEKQTPPAEEADKSSLKTPKKEKKPLKPIPNDFMLFSTPDIIRRVGKDAQTPTSETTPISSPPAAKITNEGRSKSVGGEQGGGKSANTSRSSLDGRTGRDRRTSSDKSRKNSTDKRTKEEGGKRSADVSEKFDLETMPTPEDIRSIIMTEDVKSYTTNSIPLILQTSEISSSGGGGGGGGSSSSSGGGASGSGSGNNNAQDQIGLDAADGLDLDQSILDNINNDEISEDILYQVAQSLVMNTDLRNAIDKGLNEGNLLLDAASMQEGGAVEAQQQQQQQQGAQQQGAQQTKDQQPEEQQTDIIKEATQIVRPDGRILILPPIERPATRSRNRKKNNDESTPASPPPLRTPAKPLDDEHVSGNELDDTEDDLDDDHQEEDESEDDPNKLWCICNQPHNNRFMICCDTCEEWYHGKCVNITKTMGQQMEEEGREWICLFCKDTSLKRPQAAARRIRKASRASTDSAESSKRSSGTTTPKRGAESQQTTPKKAERTASKTGKPGAPVTCIVCHKPARENSIYCSQNCILTHASGVERVVVFERSTGRMLSGSKAPSSSNLEQWLKAHPTFEVYRSGGKIVTSKIQQRQQNQHQNLTQSKLKIVKNSENHGVSLEVRRKGIKVGVLKHHPKRDELSPKITKPTGVKSDGEPQKFYAKTATAPGSSKKSSDTPPPYRIVKSSTPNKPKLVQTIIKTTPTKDNIVVRDTKTQPIKTPKSRQAEMEKAQQQQQQKQQKQQQQQQQQQEEQTTPTAANSANKQEDVRENVQKTLFEQLTNRIKMDGGALKLKEEELREISTEIESQLFKCFGDTGQKYRNKYRSLIFNIKDVKNQTLWKRICERSINAYQLVRLSPDDMASQELAMWREREAKHSLDMIKKSELELLNCSRQYVLKTHKGEQVVDEENRPSSEKVDNTEVIRTLTEDHPSDGKDQKSLDASSSSSSKESSKKSSKRAHRDKDRDRRSSRERHKKRRRSTSKDRSSEKGGRDRGGSKKERKRSRSRDRHRKSSSSGGGAGAGSGSGNKSSRHGKSNDNKDGAGGGGTHISSTDKLDKRSKEILEQLVDNKIVPPLEDRLWKHVVPQEDVVPGPAESDSDHEPSSTVTIPTPPHNVEADDQASSQVAENKIIASSLTPKLDDDTNKKEQEVERSMSPPPPRKQAGEIWRGTISMIDVAHIAITAHEVSGDCTDLGDQLPSNLDIVGRISPETVWDYIGKMKCSNSKIISLVRLTAVDVVEKMPYLALYSYLSSRKRLGVVKSTNKAIKDFYILPLAPQKPIPQALLPINGPGFEESRPALLLGIVVRDRRKRGALADPLPLYPTSKKSRVSTPPVVVARTGTPPVVVAAGAATTPTAGSNNVASETPRSYTPPATTPPLPPTVNKDPRVKAPAKVTAAVTLSPTLDEKEVDDGDEPYSPEDSDPDNSMMVAPPPAPAVTPNFSEPPPPLLTKPSMASYPYTPIIPGLDVGPSLPASTLEIQKQMEELNKKIEAQKSEINNISKNIVSASTEIGHSALANIALPSNLQQILDSIKTISTEGNAEGSPVQSKPVDPGLTIPLMLPKSFTRPPPPIINKPQLDFVTNTIPLNLPTKNKLKLPPPAALMSVPPPPAALMTVPPPSVVVPAATTDSAPGLLSSLSEEELMKKAAEMLGETELSTATPPAKEKKGVAASTSVAVATPPAPKRSRLTDEGDAEGFDIEPPIPGVDNLSVG